MSALSGQKLELLCVSRVFRGALKIEKLLERFGEDKVFCVHLVQLSRCDTLGRFSADLPDDVKYQHILTLLDEG